jgi:AdoMet-dependent rRNA methyltransferase SPB1
MFLFPSLDILVLQSFKLASEFLRKGGWFITKVFRSQDYFSLLWIFQQLFKKVDSTKPQASRNESAEIFVVCQNYLAPDHIDEKFFDIKYVFSEANADQNQTQQSSANLLQTLMKPKLNQRNRGGYADNDYTLFHRLKASEFIRSNNFVVLLSKHQQIVIDDDRIKNHVSTTEEIKECLNDLSVLGANEIKNILKWRLKTKDIFKNEAAVAEVKTEEEKNVEKKKTESEDEEEEGEADEEDIDKEIVQTVDHEKKLEKK